MYNRPMQKQMDVIIRSMRTTLQEYGIDSIFEMKHGSMRICPEQFTCDAYLFFEGNLEAINSYRGGIHERLFMGEYDRGIYFLADGENHVLIILSSNAKEQ